MEEGNVEPHINESETPQVARREISVTLVVIIVLVVSIAFVVFLYFAFFARSHLSRQEPRPAVSPTPMVQEHNPEVTKDTISATP